MAGRKSLPELIEQLKDRKIKVSISRLDGDTLEDVEIGEVGENAIFVYRIVENTRGGSRVQSERTVVPYAVITGITQVD